MMAPRKSPIGIIIGLVVLIIIVIIVIVVIAVNNKKQKGTPMPGGIPTPTPTPTPTPAPGGQLTYQQQCVQNGGYIESDGSCMTASTCSAAGGTWNGSFMKCSPYTPTSCASAGGTWNADLKDCLNIPAASGDPTYTCVCGPSYCGNGATGGNPGDSSTKLSASTVESSYRPCVKNQYGGTGWTCTNDSTGANYCG
jgi:hypothetical protein